LHQLIGPSEFTQLEPHISIQHADIRSTGHRGHRRLRFRCPNHTIGTSTAKAR
jgi:hypothetical protein